MNFLNQKKKFTIKKDNGFAIPQILILGISIAVGVSGLMAASILGLTGSRITRQELLAKSSSFSGITKLRSLLNDNSQGRLFNYLGLFVISSEMTKFGEVLIFSLITLNVRRRHVHAPGYVTPVVCHAVSQW